MRRIVLLKKKPLNGKRDYRPRRVWTVQQKLEILTHADRTSTVQAAKLYDVDIRLIFQWRNDLREGMLAQRTWRTPERPKRRTRAEIAAAEVEDEES